MKSIFELGVVILLIFPTTGCHTSKVEKLTTRVSIQGTHFCFNEKLINMGSPAEGLMMNVRMVNAVFEDRGEELSKYMTGFDPMKNTDAFILKIPEYVSNGVNAFTISLQGGLPGYEGAINTAFDSNGSIRREYLQRVEKIIRACEVRNSVVILSCFYRGQHSHRSALTGKESIKKALENTVKWITTKKFTNVLLEVSNEYRHNGYRNWPDGDWLISDAGQIELIRFAKRLNPALLVSTSGMGDGKYNNALAKEVDFILIHFNNTSLEDYPSRIGDLKIFDKPIVCNEDDKLKQEGAVALALAIVNGSGGGYMNLKRNQTVPIEFLGIGDDPVVYRMFKNITTPGFQIDPESLKQTSITITFPNDGDLFRIGQNINIRISHLYPDSSIPYRIEILSNNRKLALVEDKRETILQFDRPGAINLEAVVKDLKGNELYRSGKVDVFVQSDF